MLHTPSSKLKEAYILNILIRIEQLKRRKLKTHKVGTFITHAAHYTTSTPKNHSKLNKNSER